MKYIIIVLLIFPTFIKSNGQTIIPKADSLSTIKWSDVSFGIPSMWKKTGKDETKQNLNNYVIDSNDLKEMTKFIDANEISLEYYKYDLETHVGAVPTLRIVKQQNTARNFKEFFQHIKNDVEYSKKFYPDFEYLAGPDTITVGGKKAFHGVGTYSLQVQTGEVHVARISFIAIPYGKKALFISLIDSEDDDSSTVLDLVAKSVTFIK